MHVKKFNFRLIDINVQRDDLIRAMGYTSKPAPEHLNADIDEVLSHKDELCEIIGGYRIVDNINWDRDNFYLIADNVTLHIEKTIFQQIKKSYCIAVFVCTAGNNISLKSREFINAGDLLKGYVYDVYGSLVVESAMDLIHEELKQTMLNSSLQVTNRFSPGYCGWNVAEQKKLFSLLPENFCGIELTDSCLMKPIKSVSGIIGIGKSVKFNNYNCSLCNMENCLYRNTHKSRIK